MKNLILFIFLVLTPLLSTSQIIVEPLSETKFCAGESINITFNSASIHSFGNSFIIELSDQTGDFTTPIELDKYPSFASGSHTRTVTLPLNSVDGSLYKIRVIGDNPFIISDNTTQDFTIVSNPKVTIGNYTENLIFSEYIEGNSNEKYLEIYNGTGKTIDLSDYKLRSYYNGSTTPLQDNQLIGNLNNGNVIVYKNSSATGTPIGLVHPNINFNGNDAIELYQINTNKIVDLFGQIGTDPGIEWINSPNRTQNVTLRRATSILTGVNSNPFSGFPTLGSEWTQFSLTDYSGLGSHTHDNGYDLQYCANDTIIILTGTPIAGTWTGSGIVNPSSGKFNPSIANSGSNNINYSVTSNGCTNSADIALTVNPNPIDNLVDTSYSCKNTITLNAGNPGATYSWGSGSTSQTITRATEGLVSVIITNSNGCKLIDSTLIQFPSTDGGLGTWVWEGNTSDDWFEPCNWDKKSLPNNLSDVIIPGSLTTYPKISGNTALCNTITIDVDNNGKVDIDVDNSGELQMSN